MARRGKKNALGFQDADVCASRKLCLQILLPIDGVPSSPSFLEVAHDGRRKWHPVHNKVTIRQPVAPLLSTSDVWHALRDRFLADARADERGKTTAKTLRKRSKFLLDFSLDRSDYLFNRYSCSELICRGLGDDSLYLDLFKGAIIIFGWWT